MKEVQGGTGRYEEYPSVPFYENQNHHRWLSELEFMLRVAEVAKTPPASPTTFAVPSTSLRRGSGQALRELNCHRWLSNHRRWLSEVEANPTTNQEDKGRIVWMFYDENC